MGGYQSGLTFNSAYAVLGLAALIIVSPPAKAEEIMIVCRGHVSHSSSLDPEFRDPQDEIRDYSIKEDGSVKYPTCIYKTEKGAYCNLFIKQYPAELYPLIGANFSVNLNRVTGTVEEIFTSISSAEGMAKKHPLLAEKIFSVANEGRIFNTTKFVGECTKSKGNLF